MNTHSASSPKFGRSILLSFYDRSHPWSTQTKLPHFCKQKVCKMNDLDAILNTGSEAYRYR